MIVVGILLMACYTLMLVWVATGFLKLSVFSSERTQPKTTFSIVIPFRNEAQNLPLLLTSLKQLNYPAHLFEIIFVDDESEDSSLEIIKDEISRVARNDNQLQIQLFKNKRTSASPKKDAITEAINKAQHDWVVTTDADCQVPSTWLQTFDTFIQQNSADFIAAPVALETGNGLLQNFQLFDQCSLQSLTMGSFGMKTPLLCNGANLCYKKSLFLELNGFSGNNDIASGDDIFMLQKALQKDLSKVRFLKSKKAVVTTNAQQSWSALLGQRVRWASKTSKQKSKASKTIGILVFFTNVWIVASFFVGFLQKEVGTALLLLFVAKLCIDGIIIFLSAHFFRSKKNYFYYLLSSILYPFFTVVVVIKSLIGTYEWKGRNYGSAS